MTAEQYRASLNDGRETYFGGEQIFDLPGHPILGVTVASAAKGYERFYDPAPRAIGAFMKVPSSAQELREQVELQADVYGKKVDYHGTIEGLLESPALS